MLRRTSALLFFAVLFLLPTLGVGEELGTVTYVTDGDTITCQCGRETIRVRLAEIDANLYQGVD
jgi:endonuclease YncB( thermonuclease family)